MFIRYLTLVCILFTSSNLYADVLAFNKADNSVAILSEKLNIIDFLAELEKQSGIVIHCDPAVKADLELPKTTLSLAQLLRALDAQYSTIQGFDSAGRITSLDVLPPGDGSVTRENMIPVQQLHQQKIGTDSARTSNDIPAYIDINNVSDSDWESLNEEQQTALRQALKEKRSRERKEKFNEKQKKRSEHFRSMLEKIKEEQPDLYPMYEEQYKDMITLPEQRPTAND